MTTTVPMGAQEMEIEGPSSISSVGIWPKPDGTLGAELAVAESPSWSFVISIAANGEVTTPAIASDYVISIRDQP